MLANLAALLHGSFGLSRRGPDVPSGRSHSRGRPWDKTGARLLLAMTQLSDYYNMRWKS